MAGASMNGIKARMRSVSSTMQITKAMELVATSKLRRAKERAERAKPYFELLKEAMSVCLSSDDIRNTVWAAERAEGKTLYIVIAGDRGLAGGYNSNVYRLTASLADGGDAVYLPIGKKAYEYYRHRGLTLFDSECKYASTLGVGDTLSISGAVCRAFSEGEFRRVVLVYTEFTSMLTQTPTHVQLFPLKCEEVSGEEPMIEADAEELIESIAPSYAAGVLWAALGEALASECASRRSAMSSANKNAEEMIDKLMLSYNRARQAVITQEITEIVSGAEAL